MTADVLEHGLLTRVDHDVSRQMVHWNIRHSAAKPAVYVLTLFGQRGTVLGVTIPVIAWLTWRSRTSGPLMRYVVALVLLTVAVYALKDITERAAPPVDSLHLAGAASFPSGHLTNATLMWGVTWWSALSVGAEAPLVRVLGVIRFLGPVCVVIGMTLLDYHWISDFVAGLCVAVILLWVVLHPAWQSAVDRVDARLHHAHPPG